MDMRADKYDTKEDRYQLGAVFEKAADIIKPASCWETSLYGLETPRDKMLRQLTLLNVNSIGLFIADYFDKPEDYKAAPSEVVGEKYAIEKHGMSEEQYTHALQLKTKYPEITESFKFLDRAFTDYGVLLEAQSYGRLATKATSGLKNALFNNAGFKRHTIIKKARSICETLDVTNAFENELLPFYLMEWNENQKHEDIMNSQAHYDTLIGILRKPLRETFLSSALNDFSKCPFHIIGNVFSMKMSEDNDGNAQYSSVKENGALIPFIIKKMRELNPELTIGPQPSTIAD